MLNKRGKRKFFHDAFFSKSRRGQGLQISTIILIVLGLAVLVLLIFGFMVGWQKVLPWVSSNNVDTVVNQCQAACATNDAYGFCSMERKLKAEDLPEVDGKKVKEISGTCSYFSTTESFSKYSIAECPDLCQ